MKYSSKRMSLILVFVFCVFVILAGCGSKAPAPTDTSGTTPATTPTATGKVITAKLAHVGAPDHIFEIGAQKFAELVKEYTNGSVEIKTYPGASLGGDRDTFEGLQMGTIEFSIQGPLDSFLPESSMVSLPYMFKDSASVYKYLDSDIAAEIYKGLEEKGVRCLGHMENGWRLITSNRAINSLADMNGLKIRTPESPVWTDTFKALGANPVPIAFNELYSAMQQGVVDGQENPTAHIKTQRFYEVQDYLTISRHMYLDAPLVVSEKFWSTLTQEQQEALIKAAKEAVDYQRQVSSTREAEELKFLKEQGMTITEPDLAEFAVATESVRKAWADKYGQDIYEAIVALTK